MYIYSELKQTVLTDAGQVRFLKVRDFVQRQLSISGAVRMQEAMSSAGGGDSWKLMACVDRLVELGELHELTREMDVHGQDRVFVSKG